MTRKRTKKLIDLNLTKHIEKDIIPTPTDGLPPLERYFFCKDLDGLRFKVWLKTATLKEHELAKKRQGIQPYRNISMKNPVIPRMIKLGFSEIFSQQVARLLIHKLNGMEVSDTYINTLTNTLENLFKSLSITHGNKKNLVNISNLNSDDFVDLKESIQNMSWTQKNKLGRFNYVKKLFAHESVKNNIQIQNVIGRFKQTKDCKPTQDLTSPLYTENTYSDSVMFQLLCYFIYDFERHIGYLREYEDLTEKDVLNESGGKLFAIMIKKIVRIINDSF